MDPKEREVIDGLFAKLRQVDAQQPQRDQAAESYIREQVQRLPASPYYMAQALLVQEQALGNLQNRLQELEQELTQRPAAGGGGFLSGLFGGGQPAAPAPRRAPSPLAVPNNIPPQYQQQTPGMAPGSPWGRPAGGGGGFLAGAMQTAVGVAGGMLIADALGSAFSSGTAAAADLAHDATATGAEAEAATPDRAFEDAAFEDDAAANDDLGAGDFGEEI